MKNLFKFVCMFALFAGSFVLGQKKQASNTGNQNEEIRTKLATMMAEMKDNLSTVYSSGTSYESFRSKALGRSGSAVTQEGEALLKKSYNYLVAGTSSSQIISSYDGKEMGEAYAKLIQLGVNNEHALFSTGSDVPKLDTNFNVNQHESKGSNSSGCRWYQIGCWLDDIFGAGTANSVMGVIMAWLKTVISK